MSIAGTLYVVHGVAKMPTMVSVHLKLAPIRFTLGNSPVTTVGTPSAIGGGGAVVRLCSGAGSFYIGRSAPFRRWFFSRISAPDDP